MFFFCWSFRTKRPPAGPRRGCWAAVASQCKFNCCFKRKERESPRCPPPWDGHKAIWPPRLYGCTRNSRYVNNAQYCFLFLVCAVLPRPSLLFGGVGRSKKKKKKHAISLCGFFFLTRNAKKEGESHYATFERWSHCYRHKHAVQETSLSGNVFPLSFNNDQHDDDLENDGGSLPLWSAKTANDDPSSLAVFSDVKLILFSCRLRFPSPSLSLSPKKNVSFFLGRLLELCVSAFSPLWLFFFQVMRDWQSFGSFSLSGRRILSYKRFQRTRWRCYCVWWRETWKSVQSVESSLLLLLPSFLLVGFKSRKVTNGDIVSWRERKRKREPIGITERREERDKQKPVRTW